MHALFEFSIRLREPCSSEDEKVGDVQRILADQLELLDKIERASTVLIREVDSAAD